MSRRLGSSRRAVFLEMEHVLREGGNGYNGAEGEFAGGATVLPPRPPVPAETSLLEVGPRPRERM